MNKRVIIGIIVLMSVALFGLVALQIYWINNVIRLKEQEFSQNVHSVLKEAVARHDRHVKKELLAGTIKILKGNQIIITGRDTIKMGLGEMDINENDFLESELLALTMPSTLNGNAGFEEIRQRHQQLNHMLRKMREMEKTQQLSKALRVISGEISSQFMNMGQRINLDLLQRYLDEGLQRNGIDLDYQFAVMEPGDDSVHTLASQCNRKALVNSSYKTELFPEQYFLNPYYLSIHFPKKINYLLQTIQFRLLTSFIFILIIIFSFGFTIWTIFRQKRLSDMKNDFINNMTHEFKTPITTISLAGQALTDPDIAQEPQRIVRFSSMILDESAKLGSQVEKILQMAIMDKGEFRLKVKEIEVHELLEGIAESYQIRFDDDPEAYITLNLEAEHAIIQGDELHIGNLIDNLIDNAVKYCKEHPQIDITTKNKKDGLEIAIQDHGIGMSKDAVKRIFERFYRVPTGNIHNVKGFGLGLAYVKTIVDAHSGTITVSSETGEGTRFTIWLPFVHEPK